MVMVVLPTMDMEAVVIITEAHRVSRAMEVMDTMEREMLSQAMAMEVMDLPLSVFPSLIMDMDIQLPTATVMTLPMVMAREMLRLSQDMVVMLPATPTDLHRVSLDMEVTVMEDTEDMVTMAREMLRLSQDMVMLPATLTDPHRVSLLDMVVMGMEDMVVMVMARDLLSQVMVMLLLLTIHMEDPALSTEAPKV